MSNERSPDDPSGPIVPDGESSTLRDEGDDAVPSPEFLADAFRRLARYRSRDADRALEIASLIESRGYDAGTLAEILEEAEHCESHISILEGIARVLRRVTP